jgi:hypothetical protein
VGGDLLLLFFFWLWTGLSSGAEPFSLCWAVVVATAAAAAVACLVLQSTGAPASLGRLPFGVVSHTQNAHVPATQQASSVPMCVCVYVWFACMCAQHAWGSCQRVDLKAANKRAACMRRRRAQPGANGETTATARRVASMARLATMASRRGCSPLPPAPSKTAKRSQEKNRAYASARGENSKQRQH